MNRFVLLRFIFAVAFVLSILLVKYFDILFPGMYCEGFGCLGYGIFLSIGLPLFFLLFFVVFDFAKFKESRAKHSFLTIIIFLVVYFIGYQVESFLLKDKIRKNILSGYVSEKEICDRGDVWDESQRNYFCGELLEEIKDDRQAQELLCDDDLESYFCRNFLKAENSFLGPKIDLDGKIYGLEENFYLDDKYEVRFIRNEKGPLQLEYSKKQLGESCSLMEIKKGFISLATQEEVCVSTTTCDAGTDFCFTLKYFKDNVYYVESEISDWDYGI